MDLSAWQLSRYTSGYGSFHLARYEYYRSYVAYVLDLHRVDGGDFGDLVPELFPMEKVKEEKRSKMKGGCMWVKNGSEFF